MWETVCAVPHASRQSAPNQELYLVEEMYLHQPFPRRLASRRMHQSEFGPGVLRTRQIQILHIAFATAGADQLFHFLVNWDQYLSRAVTRMLPVSGHTFLLEFD